MQEKELQNQILDLVGGNLTQITQAMELLDADAMINLTSAVEDQDLDVIKEILASAQNSDQAEMPTLTTSQMMKEINHVGKRLIKQQQDLDPVWSLISQISKNDWNLIWPAIQEPILKQLYKEQKDQDVEEVSRQVAQEIWQHAQKFVTEQHVLYKGQICEIQIPRGPDHTLGIRYQGKLIMVSRQDVHRLDEQVLGMTGMPHLGRMLELAGVDTQVRQPAPPHVKLMHAPTTDVHSHKVCTMLCADCDDHVQQIAAGLQDHSLSKAEMITHARMLIKKAQQLCAELQQDTDVP